jgi:hypothetical protein
LAVYADATVSRIHHVIEPTLMVERETHVDEGVIKEARAPTLMCVVAAVYTPRVGEEWIGHAMVQVAKNGLKESERIGKPCVKGPTTKVSKVKGIFWEGYTRLPAGAGGPMTMVRTPRSWWWRWPDPSGIVGLLKEMTEGEEVSLGQI